MVPGLCVKRNAYEGDIHGFAVRAAMLELFAHPFPDEGRMSHSFRLGQAFHRLALGGGVHGLDPLPM